MNLGLRQKIKQLIRFVHDPADYPERQLTEAVRKETSRADSEFANKQGIG